MVVRRLSIRAIVIITVSTLGCVVIACGLVVYVVFKPLADIGEALGGCAPTNPSEIEDIAGFILPPSYRNLESSCFGLQGWGAHARFEIDPVDLDSFIASTLIESPLSSEDLPDSSYFPSDLSSHLYGKYETTEYSQYILIDTSNRTSYVIYVEVFGG